MEETLGTQSGRPETHPRKDSLCAKPPTAAAELNSPGAEAKPVSSAVAEEARDGDCHQNNVQGNLEHVQHGYYLLSLDKATSKNRVAAI